MNEVVGSNLGEAQNAPKTWVVQVARVKDEQSAHVLVQAGEEWSTVEKLMLSFRVQATESTEAVRRGCKSAVRLGLALQESAGDLPVDVHVLELVHGQEWSRFAARIDARSGRTLCYSAGRVSRLP